MSIITLKCAVNYNSCRVATWWPK